MTVLLSRGEPTYRYKALPVIAVNHKIFQEPTFLEKNKRGL